MPPQAGRAGPSCPLYLLGLLEFSEALLRTEYYMPLSKTAPSKTGDGEKNEKDEEDKEGDVASSYQSGDSAGSRGVERRGGPQ